MGKLYQGFPIYQSISRIIARFLPVACALDRDHHDAPGDLANNWNLVNRPGGFPG